MIIRRTHLLISSLMLLGACVAGDPDWGLKRVGAIERVPDRDCVATALSSIPGVRAVHNVSSGGRNGFEAPEALYFNLMVIPSVGKMLGGVQVTRRNGMLQYEAWYTAARYAPSEADAAFMRTIYEALERKLADSCGATTLPQRVVETCNHLRCTAAP